MSKVLKHSCSLVVISCYWVWIYLKIKQQINSGYNQEPCLWSINTIGIIIICIVFTNIGSNIVLNSVVQLKAVLDAQGHFVDSALKTGLFPWSLPLLSCPCQNLLLGRKTAQDRLMLVFIPVPCIFSGKWYPGWRCVKPSADLLGWPLGVIEGEMSELCYKLLHEFPTEDSL